MDKDEQQKKDAADAAKSSQQQSIFDMLKPNFSLGGMLGMGFWTLLFIGILYLAIEYIPQVRQLAEKYLPEDWQIGINQAIAGIGMPPLFPDATVDKYLGGLDANSDDPNKKTIRSVMLSQVPDEAKDFATPIITAITADKQTALDFVKLVQTSNKDAKGNPGQLNMQNILSANTIYAMLTQKPPVLARKIVDALPALQAGGTPSASTQQLMASFTSIIADRAKFNAILSGDSFDVTLDALAKLAPSMGVAIDSAALKGFVRAVGMNGDVPNDLFYNFTSQLLAAKGADGKADMAQIKTAFAQLVLDPQVLAHPEALAQLANGIHPSDPALETSLNMLRHNAGPVSRLLQQLGPDRAAAYLNAQINGSDSVTVGGQSMSMLQFIAGNQAAFDAFAGTQDKELDVASLDAKTAAMISQWRKTPAAQRQELMGLESDGVDVQGIQNLFIKDGKANVADITTALLDPVMRNSLRGQIDKSPQKVDNLLRVFTHGVLSKTNAEELITLGTNLGHVQENRDNPERTKAVVGALLQMIVNKDPSAFTALSPEDRAAFFSQHANQAALLAMLQRLDISQMPKAQQALVQELRADGSKIFDALGNAGAERLIDKFLKGQMGGFNLTVGSMATLAGGPVTGTILSSDAARAVMLTPSIWGDLPALGRLGAALGAVSHDAKAPGVTPAGSSQAATQPAK